MKGIVSSKPHSPCLSHCSAARGSPRRRGKGAVAVAAALLLAGVAAAPLAGQEEGQHDDECPSIFYVSASAGLDTNPGTQTSQFKTITHAMSVATRRGSTVHVAHGVYDTPGNN